MTFVFKHPKYYKELRSRNKSGQAISDEASTEATSVRPDPGPKLQATSSKRQASSSKLRQKRIASLKPQAASFKLQATSYKFLDSWTTEKFHGAWTKGL